MKQYLTDNLYKGFIKLSQTLFTSPILFIRKANKSLYFYINYSHAGPDDHPDSWRPEAGIVLVLFGWGEIYQTGTTLTLGFWQVPQAVRNLGACTTMARRPKFRHDSVVCMNLNLTKNSKLPKFLRCGSAFFLAPPRLCLKWWKTSSAIAVESSIAEHATGTHSVNIVLNTAHYCKHQLRCGGSVSMCHSSSSRAPHDSDAM